MQTSILNYDTESVDSFIDSDYQDNKGIQNATSFKKFGKRSLRSSSRFK